MPSQGQRLALKAREGVDILPFPRVSGDLSLVCQTIQKVASGCPWSRATFVSKGLRTQMLGEVLAFFLPWPSPAFLFSCLLLPLLHRSHLEPALRFSLPWSSGLSGQ